MSELALDTNAVSALLEGDEDLVALCKAPSASPYPSWSSASIGTG